MYIVSGNLSVIAKIKWMAGTRKKKHLQYLVAKRLKMSLLHRSLAGENLFGCALCAGKICILNVGQSESGSCEVAVFKDSVGKLCSSQVRSF